MKYDLSKIWVFDCETDGLLAKVTKINTVVFTNCGDMSKTYSFRADDSGSRSIDEAFKLLLRILETDNTYIAGHNIAGFDLGVFAKLYDFDILKYYNKVIDTSQLSSLMYPKHKLKKSKLNTNIPHYLPHLIDSHGLLAWSYRVSPNSTKEDYRGISAGICIDTKGINDEDISKVHTILKKHDVTYSYENMVTKSVPFECAEELLLIDGVLTRKATESELFKSRWEVFDMDDLVHYCVQDVRSNVFLLRYFLKRDNIPFRKVQKIEIYNAFIASMQTIYGWKIDTDKLHRLDAKLNLELRTLDLKLEGMFEPYYALEESFYTGLWEHLFKLYKDLGISKSFDSYRTDKTYITLIAKKLIQKGMSKNTVDYIVESLLKSFETMKYTTRNTSVWVEVTKCIPNSIGMLISSKLSYTKAGKPKAIKAWMKNLKQDEDGTWFRRVPITQTNLRDTIKLTFFKAGSRASILTFMQRKYDYTPVERTESEALKLDIDVFDKLPYVEAPLLCDRFRVNKKISEVNTLKSHLINGRIHHNLNVLGADATNRMSANSP